MGSVYDYSTNAGTNTSAPPNGAPEGWNPGDVNAVVREVMASIASMAQAWPWANYAKPFSLTRNSNTQFQVNAVDQTTLYTVGRRVRLIGATTGYGIITVSTFSSPNTVITVEMDSGNVPTSLASAEALIVDGVTTSGLRYLRPGMTNPTIASASSIALPTEPDAFFISGTTNISTITGGWPGRRVTLVFTGALTVIDSSSLNLAGNFTTTADDTLSLVFMSNGNWYETGRSVN